MNELQKQLDADFELHYKEVMKDLYSKWRNRMEPNSIRECFSYWVAKHSHRKTMELLQGRRRRAIIMRNLKEKSRLMEYKIKEDNLINDIGADIELNTQM